MRIFLSYGHDRYGEMAVELKRELEARGYEVWFDLERLKAGSDWEQYIESGLDWASTGSGRFVLLMTPHSVRRPDGYCLNELARAFARNLRIVPVMVSDVELPLSICRIQWLDMRRGLQPDALIDAIEHEKVDIDGVQARLASLLHPLPYEADRARLLERFEGREWVMRDVEVWLAGNQRVLWITGPAGAGKSALSAWLSERRPEIAAVHYCRFGNSDRMD